MSRPLLTLLATALWLAVPACHTRETGASAGPVVEFGAGRVEIVTAADTFLLRVEIAETVQQQVVGLQGRTELPEDQGMLFLFAEEQPEDSGFWMYRTYLPLSVAFLDAGDTIRAIREMEPCRRRIALLCPGYEAGVPYHAALEVNQGYFARRGIQVGDWMILRRSSP